MTTQTAEPRKNFTRTWEAKLYGSWGDGASVLIRTCILTVTADHEGTQTATIDGEPTSLEEAYRVYLWAKNDHTLTVLHEEELPAPPAPLKLPPPVIGKARAHKLHKIMGAAGLPRAQHYALSAAALGEPWPLESLSNLTETEARAVWRHLCRTYPDAYEIGKNVQAKAAATNAAA